MAKQRRRRRIALAGGEGSGGIGELRIHIGRISLRLQRARPASSPSSGLALRELQRRARAFNRGVLGQLGIERGKHLIGLFDLARQHQRADQPGIGLGIVRRNLNDLRE